MIKDQQKLTFILAKEKKKWLIKKDYKTVFIILIKNINNVSMMSLLQGH